MKGQFSITSILSVLIAVIVFGAIYPTLSTTIAGVSGLDAGTAALLALVPFFMVVAIIIGIVYHAIPTKEVVG